MNLKKVLSRTLDFLLNDKLFDWYIILYQRYFKVKADKARIKYHTKRIKNIGFNSRIRGEPIIHYIDNLSVGSYVRIGEGAFLFCKGGISIGDNTQISRNILIYSADHHMEGEAIPYDDKYIDKPVTIGKSVWIGMNVVITPGVSIGDGAVIGMGTVVSKDIPAGAVVVGAKQRTIKYRDMNNFHEKDKEKAWFGKKWPTI